LLKRTKDWAGVGVANRGGQMGLASKGEKKGGGENKEKKKKKMGGS